MELSGRIILFQNDTIPCKQNKLRREIGYRSFSGESLRWEFTLFILQAYFTWKQATFFL